MEDRCRLCAEVCIDLVSILEDLDLTNRIFELFQVKVDLEDRLPTLVCQLCWEMVRTTWLNHLKVQKAQELLSALLDALVTVNAVDDLTFAAHSPKTIDCAIISDTIEMVKGEEMIGAVPTAEKSSTSLKSKKVKKTITKKKELVREVQLCDINDVEFNDDGSVVPKQQLFGWETYIWACCDCEQNFTSSEDLRDHYAAMHNQSAKYYCTDCQKIYTKYNIFLIHVRSHRDELKFSCDICYKWFLTQSNQDKHRVVHNEDRPYVCLSCGKGFRMQSALALHSRSHLPAEIKNKYHCDLCPKRFGTKPNLMAHKRIHTGIREYTCDQCGKSFVQKGNLDNHLLTHTSARPFTCSTCGKTFKTLIRLKKHDTVHSGLKPHQCDICGRHFRERSTLKEHHRIHTGAMPFSCEFCGKCFRFKGVLTTHRRQHTGERPYSCHECQHHFTNWPNYNKHMIRRHGINTSVTVRKPQSIPPTGMPHRNPPGTVLAPPQPIVLQDSFVEHQTSFYPVLGFYNISEDILTQRV